MILTGMLEAKRLVTDLPEFADEFQNYLVDKVAIAPLAQRHEPAEIQVILGTWCPDCFREVPRLIRIMEQAANAGISVTYLGVDKDKKDPQGLTATCDFERIPTIIIKQNGIETGRIVERPTQSLEVDLAQLLG